MRVHWGLQVRVRKGLQVRVQWGHQMRVRCGDLGEGLVGTQATRSPGLWADSRSAVSPGLCHGGGHSTQSSECPRNAPLAFQQLGDKGPFWAMQGSRGAR